MFNRFRKKKVDEPSLSADEIRIQLGKLFVSNYFSVQESVLGVFDLKDFFEGDWPDSEFAAKVCVEYSMLLFELSVFLFSISPRFDKATRADFYNHLYRAHLVSTQDAATVLSTTLEDKGKCFSDDSHFDATSAYYTNVMLKRIPPIHFGSFRPFNETSPFRKYCNDLFNIFAHHLIYFLYTDDYCINTDSPLPLISPVEIISLSDFFNSFADFTATFLKESTKTLGIA